MARNATSENVNELRDLYTPLIEAMTHDTAATLEILQGQARLALNRYLDAVAATSNINASAASSYSTSVGSSTQKRLMDEAQANEDAALGRFEEALELGGQYLPGTGSGFYWDLSGQVA
jgi:hypothetical protein|tara:strand:- start:351 stop:707 length:357 start_codon:yes stop_codon:yes gene_type:complete